MSTSTIAVAALASLFASAPPFSADGIETPLCHTRITTHRNAVSPFALALNDGSFAVAYREGSSEAYAIAWSHLDASGALLDGPRLVTPRAQYLSSHALATNATRVGLSWVQHVGNSLGVFFRSLQHDGMPASGILRLDDAPDPLDPDGTLPLVTRSGRQTGELIATSTGWTAGWRRFTDTGDEFRTVNIAANGHSATVPQTVDDRSGDVFDPQLAANEDPGLFWFDTTDDEVAIRFRPGSNAPSVTVITDDSAVFGFSLDAAWNGSEYGLAWTDRRDGDTAVYFVRADRDGNLLSTPTRISDSGGFVIADNLVLAWLGDRWVVAADYVSDAAPVDFEVGLSFASATGEKMGSDVIVSTPVDGLFSGSPSLAFSDDVLLVAWHDAAGDRSAEIHVQAIDADGAPGTNPRQQLSAGHSPGFGVVGPPEIVSTGNGLILAWSGNFVGANGNGPWLQLVEPDGRLQGNIIDVPETVGAVTIEPRLAFGGGTVAALWADTLTNRLLLSRFHPSGLRQGPDLVVSASIARFDLWDIHWDGQQFLVAWVDTRDGAREIYTAIVDVAGLITSGPNRISNHPARSRRPTIAGGEQSRVVVWEDQRGTETELWAAALNALGQRVGAESAVTADDGIASDRPDLAFNGSGFGLAWVDRGPEASQVHFVRVVNALPVGQSIQVSECLGSLPRIAWGDDRWGIIFFSCSGGSFSEVSSGGTLLTPEQLVFSSPNNVRRPNLTRHAGQFAFAIASGVPGYEDIFLSSAPCVFDATAPSCPTDLNVTAEPSGDVNISWSPGLDADSSVLHHLIFRNGRRVAAVDPPSNRFIDPLVAPGLHRYVVTTVNEALLESVDCSSETADTGNVLFGDGFENSVPAFSFAVAE